MNKFKCVCVSGGYLGEGDGAGMGLSGKDSGGNEGGSGEEMGQGFVFCVRYRLNMICVRFVSRVLLHGVTIR
jgi:hypothetical protein